MRKILNNKNSTKAERRFHESLKAHRIPFLFRKKVLGREIDFLIGKIAIEIDGHDQDRAKNKLLLEAGYSLVHLSNREVLEQKYSNIIKQCLQHVHQLKPLT